MINDFARLNGKTCIVRGLTETTITVKMIYSGEFVACLRDELKQF
jgi:hypothetical protein